jgi:hypothetical protein
MRLWGIFHTNGYGIALFCRYMNCACVFTFQGTWMDRIDVLLTAGNIQIRTIAVEGSF